MRIFARVFVCLYRCVSFRCEENNRTKQSTFVVILSESMIKKCYLLFRYFSFRFVASLFSFRPSIVTPRRYALKDDLSHIARADRIWHDIFAVILLPEMFESHLTSENIISGLQVLRVTMSRQL